MQDGTTRVQQLKYQERELGPLDIPHCKHEASGVERNETSKELQSYIRRKEKKIGSLPGDEHKLRTLQVALRLEFSNVPHIIRNDRFGSPTVEPLRFQMPRRVLRRLQRTSMS